MRLNTGSLFLSLCMAASGLLILSSSASAKILSVKVNCDYEKVIAGQTFPLEISVSTDGDTPPAPEIPNFANLTIRRNPQVAPSKSFMSLNGNIQTTFTYHFLAQTNQIGNFRLAGIKAGGVEADPLIIQIVDPRDQSRKEGETPPIYVESEVDKTEVWQGQQILFDFYIYDRIGGLVDLNAPGLENALNDFIFKRIEDQSKNQTNTIVNGQTYMKIHGIRYALFPLKAGEFEVGPIQLKARVELRGDPRDSFFSFSRPKRVPVEQVTGGPVISKPVKIKVKPLPAQNRPPDFTGAVGNFSFKADLSRNEVTVGESVTLKVTIIGNANFDTIAEPSLALPPEIEKYDVEKNSDIKFGGDLLRGTVEYDFILIPREEGEHVIDALTFSYFDPETESYRTLQRGPFRLKVKPDEGQSITYYKGKRKRIRVTGQDFRHIRRTGAASLRDEGTPVTATFGYWTFMTAPWFGYFFLLAYRRRADYLEANPDVAKKVRSKGRLKGRFAKATSLLEGNESEFFAELESAIHDHLSAQLGISTRGMTRSQLVDTLSKTRSGPEFAESMTEVLDQLDALRYAPGETSPKVRANLLQQVRTKLEGFSA
ncbi:MAG: protein BatD [Candidatus Omnitrophica bacterium]|nr:protein BatD [Candidatus Omnitrophota bacterium]